MTNYDDQALANEVAELEYHGAYNTRFQTNGYAQLLGINLVVFLYLALVIGCLWILCELKDLIVRKLIKF